MSTPLKCLLLSENESFTRQLSGILQAWNSDIITDEAHDYFMAGWKASRFKPDLVILDLGKCGTKALKVCELMRAFFEYKNTPFLVFTTEMTKELKKKISAIGPSDCLIKPFLKNHFLKKVSEMIWVPSTQKIGA